MTARSDASRGDAGRRCKRTVRLNTDRQTGLATIGEFMARESDVDARCRASAAGDLYGIVLIDIEGLRSINHEFGFDAGDEVLRTIADRLRAVFEDRPPLCIARIGGDEFAVLVEGREESMNLSQLARKIRFDVAGKPVTTGDNAIHFRLRTTFRRGPNKKPEASDLLWEVQWGDRVDATHELHQRLEALEQRDGVLVGQAEDLRQRLASAQQRATLGLYDDLTGLLNRRGLRETLTELSGPRVVAFVDIDNLRELNGTDDQNWEAGDQALAGVARLLQTLPARTVVVRWGGDEFLVIVPGNDVAGVEDELTELIRRARRELRFGGVEVTFSAGLAIARRSAEQDGAQSAARGAAKTAKASGRAQVIAVTWGAE
jgi:diguanylate cyclase (GGDEF)-like protein